MRNERGSNEREKESPARSPKRKSNSNRTSSPKKIESPRSKKIRAKTANDTEDAYPKSKSKVLSSTVKTDNRRMTGNVNIYICSEATENIQAKPGKEKSGTETVSETETELSARSDSATSNKLLNKIRRKRKESRDDSLDYIPEKEETESSNSDETNIRSSESEAKEIPKLEPDLDKYLERPCPRSSPGKLSSDSSSMIVCGGENSRNRRTICPLNLRTNSVDSGDWTTRPVRSDSEDKSYWKFGEPCPIRGRREESSDEWLPNSICPDIYDRDDGEVKCVCQERETSVCGTRSDSGDDSSLVCNNKGASDTEESCSLHSVCGDSDSIKTDRKSRFGRELSVCSCIMEEEREEDHGTNEKGDYAMVSTELEKHEALPSMLNSTDATEKRDSLREQMKEDDNVAIQREEDTATIKDDSTEKADDRPRASNSSSRRRSTGSGKLNSYAENKMGLIEKKEQEAEKDDPENEDFAKSPPGDLLAKQEPHKNKTRPSLNLPKLQLKVETPSETTSPESTELTNGNARKKSKTLSDKNHTNDKNHKRRSTESGRLNSYGENKMVIIDDKEHEAEKDNLENEDFSKSPAGDLVAQQEPPKNKTRPSLNLPKPQLKVETPPENTSPQPTEPPNAKVRKKSKTLNDKNHANDKNRKRRSTETGKLNGDRKNKMDLIGNKQQEAKKNNSKNGDFSKNSSDNSATKQGPPKNKTRPSINLTKLQLNVENPLEAANSKPTEPANVNSRRKSKSVDNENPTGKSNFEKEIKLPQSQSNKPEDQPERKDVEESKKSVEDSTEKEVSKTEPRKTFRERIKDTFCYRGVKRMIDAIKRRGLKSADTSKKDGDDSERTEEERLADDKLNLERSIATRKKLDDKLKLENDTGPTRDPAESEVAPKLPEDNVLERNGNKATTITDKQQEEKSKETKMESKAASVEATRDDRRDWTKDGVGIYGASQWERRRPKLLKVLAKRGAFLSRAHGPAQTGPIERISAEWAMDEVKQEEIKPEPVEFLEEEEPRKSRKESKESKERVESEAPSPETVVTDKAEKKEELETTDEKPKDVEEQGETTDEKPREAEEGKVRTSLQEQSRMKEQQEKGDKDVEVEKRESIEVGTVERGSFGEDIHAARANLKPSIGRGSKIDEEIRGSRVSESRNGPGAHPKSCPARYETRVRLCPVHSDRRNRCECNCSCSCSCSCGKSVRRRDDARNARNREKDRVHRNKDGARRGSCGRSLFCLYCDNPRDRCLCRGPIEKCTGCGLSRDLCGCRQDRESLAGRPVPCQEYDDRRIRVTAWTPRREVRRYFARDPERGRAGKLRATPSNSAEDCRCRDKLKPHGSDDLPYQRLSAFSNVMDELQRKISCTRCKKVPCRCLGPKIDGAIEEEPRTKNRLDRARIVKVTTGPERSRGKRRCEERTITDRGIAPVIHVCRGCKATPCRCKPSTGRRKGPRAKCYYCKSLPCVCITPGEQSKPSSRPCRCTDSQCRAGEKVFKENSTLHNIPREKLYMGGRGQPRVQVSTLNELIAALHDAFKTDHVDIDLVQDLMASYKSNPLEWKKYAKFDRYRYTRNLVDEGNGRFNLMVLCWGEGHGSAIHDHANAHCVMKVIQGELCETRYAWPNTEDKDSNEDSEGLKELRRNTLGLNEICYINDSLGLHRVENPSAVNPAVSLHLYCPPFSTCSVFNKQTGQRSLCKVTFWSKYGEKRNREIQDSRCPEDN